jgi:hypothetical protein
MALTIASFVCVLLINLGGLSKSSSTLNSLYFFQADFKNFSTDSSTLGTAIDLARNEGFIADFYRIGLWNYWSGNESSTSSVQTVTYLSPRKTGFWFDPYQVWNLEKAVNASENVATSLAGTKVDSNVVSQLKSYVTGNADALYEKVLDSGTRKSIQLYAKVSKWMFAAYFAGMWALLLTILFGLLAIFSRFGSFLTWICSIVSFFSPSPPPHLTAIDSDYLSTDLHHSHLCRLRNSHSNVQRRRLHPPRKTKRLQYQSQRLNPHASSNLARHGIRPCLHPLLALHLLLLRL